MRLVLQNEVEKAVLRIMRPGIFPRRHTFDGLRRFFIFTVPESELRITLDRLLNVGIIELIDGEYGTPWLASWTEEDIAKGWKEV